jgi:trehalose utilization protein
MRSLGSICAAVTLAWLLLCSGTTSAAEPLKALILTSPGVYHDYEQQTRDLAYGIAKYANVRFDVSLADIERWKTTDFSAGYDVLIYNICMADNQDTLLIANLRRQTETLGVPAVVIHCTMHSFRETDLWWPMFALKTKAHEALRALPQVLHEPHPILSGLPKTWTVQDDELYLNLEFAGQTLLSSVDETGKANTTAWLAGHGATPIFGTTLGHSEETFKDPAYHRLLANAVLYVSGNLQSDGTPKPGYEPLAEGMDILDKFSAPQGVKFLGQEGNACAMRKLTIAAIPCYSGCIFNPLLWNEASRACKQQCEKTLPSNDELIAACTPAD